MRPARDLASGIGLTVAALVGCAPVLAPGVPTPDDDLLGFQECEPPFVFEGETTIVELGITDPRLTHELTMRGHISVTRDRVTNEDFAPPGGPVTIPEGQVLCATWADGSGMAMMLAEPWPPGGLQAMPAGSWPTALVVIGAAGAVLAIVAVCWLAFRRGAGGSSHPPG